MYERLFSCGDTKKGYFLFGPRGTGKTTWLKAHYRSALYIDLLSSENYIRLSSNPAGLEARIQKGFQDWVIIDEIQRIPQLLNEVHRLIESRGIPFILTGSSARTLRRGGVNLLAGRALTYHLFPLTAIELKDDFSLDQSLRYGHLPAVFSEPDRKAFLSSYITTYLKEEVQQEGLTRNIGAFSRFLEAASFSHGSVVNFSEVGRECGVHRKVVENYFSILEDLLLGTHLPVFTRRAKRSMTARPKFYFFDAGVFQMLRPRGPLDSYSEVSGPALEGLFLQEVRAINEYRNLGYQIFFWRTSSRIEVDFVLYGERGFKAFEIKASKQLRQKDLRGLSVFAEDYPEAELYLVYMGDHREYHDDIQVLPMDWALRNLGDVLT